MPTVALFVTCLTDQFYPRVGIAVTKILEKLGCPVVFPPDQTCCGQPFFNNGYHPQAKELAKKMVTVFEPFDFIVTPSGSCCAMVREHMPHLLEGDPAWEPGMRRIVSNTYEFVEFLTKVLKADLSHLTLPQQKSVTYHYTCHLRGIGVKDEGVRLLRQIGNVDFRPLEKTDQCCGFGGTFALKNAATSVAIGIDKVKHAQSSSVEVLCALDNSCLTHIGGIASRKDVSLRTMHLAEILAKHE